MMQGDSYSLSLKLKTNDGCATPEDFKEIEVCIGNTIRKTHSSGEIKFDSEHTLFLVPLTQEETFGLRGRVRVNVRCKYLNGNVIGRDLGVIEFTDALSKEVL